MNYSINFFVILQISFFYSSPCYRSKILLAILKIFFYSYFDLLGSIINIGNLIMISLWTSFSLYLFSAILKNSILLLRLLVLVYHMCISVTIVFKQNIFIYQYIIQLFLTFEQSLTGSITIISFLYCSWYYKWLAFSQ